MQTTARIFQFFFIIVEFQDPFRVKKFDIGRIILAIAA